VIRKAISSLNGSIIRARDINLLESDGYIDQAPSFTTLKEAEKMVIKRALELTKGNKAKAALMITDCP